MVSSYVFVRTDNLFERELLFEFEEFGANHGQLSLIVSVMKTNQHIFKILLLMICSSVIVYRLKTATFVLIRLCVKKLLCFLLVVPLPGPFHFSHSNQNSGMPDHEL